jgi:hypothetical protein
MSTIQLFLKFKANQGNHYKMRTIEENYQQMKDDTRSFDIRFWQSQGDQAIFEAALEMLHDYFLIRGKDANEFRLQRSVESFRKA